MPDLWKQICVQQSCEHVAYRFISCAFVLSPFSESPRHRSQNLSCSFFSEEGFLPAKAAPGISSSVRITASESRLVEAIFAVIDHPWPTKPRSHVFETRPFRTAAIYKYGVFQSTKTRFKTRCQTSGVRRIVDLLHKTYTRTFISVVRKNKSDITLGADFETTKKN